MQFTDILAQMGGVQSIARDLGVSESQAARGADALLPAILGGFKKQAQAHAGGLDGLGGLLGQLGGGGLLDQVLSPRPTDPAPGNDVLGQIFGSKDISRTVAQDAAGQTGLDPALLKRMLPILAMLVAGVMTKQGAAAAPAPAPGASGLGGMLGDLLSGQAARGGTSGLGALLDMNGDGNALDDILRLAGKVMR
ncbi:MAG: DUF937 domain-containing protein [Rubrivivax sp.]|nr:DUF937 domain-containing protein [Rubrivivax sp.]